MIYMFFDQKMALKAPHMSKDVWKTEQKRNVGMSKRGGRWTERTQKTDGFVDIFLARFNTLDRKQDVTRTSDRSIAPLTY